MNKIDKFFVMGTVVILSASLLVVSCVSGSKNETPNYVKLAQKPEPVVTTPSRPNVYCGEDDGETMYFWDTVDECWVASRHHVQMGQFSEAAFVMPDGTISHPSGIITDLQPNEKTAEIVMFMAVNLPNPARTSLPTPTIINPYE